MKTKTNKNADVEFVTSTVNAKREDQSVQAYVNANNAQTGNQIKIKYLGNDLKLIHYYNNLF